MYQDFRRTTEGTGTFFSVVKKINIVKSVLQSTESITKRTKLEVFTI